MGQIVTMCSIASYILEKWSHYRASELMFCYHPLNHLIHPSPPFTFTFCVFFFFSGSHPNSISYQVTSWSSVSDDLFFSLVVFFLFSFLLYLFCVLSSSFLSFVLQRTRKKCSLRNEKLKTSRASEMLMLL